MKIGTLYGNVEKELYNDSRVRIDLLNLELEFKEFREFFYPILIT